MIYIHIPFCRTKCIYCGFYSELPTRKGGGSDCSSLQGRLVDALCLEMEASRVQTEYPDCSTDCPDDRKSPDTVYIGGGTPSLLSIGELEKLVGAVNEFRGNSGLVGPPEEFTVEVNPDDIVRGGEEYAVGLKSLGVNRVSMGVQSFDDAVLHRMGRRHSSDEAVKAFHILREAGFDNISIDLIFGFTPLLDTALISRGFDAFGSPPEHVSCYQLSVEPGSGLEKMLSRGLITLPTDEQCEVQYNQLCSFLREAGYNHYEISNWALSGRESRHNSAYWRHVPYSGFGPGAHSLKITPEEKRELLNDVPAETGESVLLHRRWNKPDLAAYLRAASEGCFDSVREGEILTPEQVREEKIMLGLRTADGVDAALLADGEFRDRPENSLGNKLLRLQRDGLLERIKTDGTGDSPRLRFRIPESRWFISDSIISKILL